MNMNPEQTNLPGEPRRGRRRLIIIAQLITALAALAFFIIRPARQLITGSHTHTGQEAYYCPMHPGHRSDKPGNCPVWRVKLGKLEKGAPVRGQSVAATPHPLPMSST